MIQPVPHHRSPPRHFRVTHRVTEQHHILVGQLWLLFPIAVAFLSSVSFLSFGEVKRNLISSHVQNEIQRHQRRAKAAGQSRAVSAAPSTHEGWDGGMRISPGHLAQIFVSPPPPAEPPGVWLSSSEGFFLTGWSAAVLGFGASCPAMSRSAIAPPAKHGCIRHSSSKPRQGQLLPWQGTVPQSQHGPGTPHCAQQSLQGTGDPPQSFRCQLPMVLCQESGADGDGAAIHHHSLGSSSLEAGTAQACLEQEIPGVGFPGARTKVKPDCGQGRSAAGEAIAVR